MAVKTLYSAESWEKIYQAFESVNFVSYDYDSIKGSVLDYLKHYYKEDFNDYIESSEFIALIEIFAYIAEQTAYRVDMAMHENTMDGAARKQSILRLAKLISYNATRNLPARGLVKITSVSTTESVVDSQGNNLSNRVIKWNDTNNPLWKEQFFLVMNRVMLKQFGQPLKSYQIDDVAFQLYSLNNTPKSFIDSVHKYTVSVAGESIAMEVVSSDIDENGPFEKYIDGSKNFQVMFANDGLGDSSDTSGFMMYTKQGKLYKYEYSFDTPIPNRSIDISIPNVNDVDVWVNKVDENSNTLERWLKVDNINTVENIHFNTIKERIKFEVETLEDDKIRLIFGDGDFSAIPMGKFEVWFRTSINRNIIIQKSRVVDQSFSFSYRSKYDFEEKASFTFSLVSSLQNSSVSEDIEHIRRTAPTTYYSQGRMVNAQDYNTLLLKDPSILRLRAINRTFAGQPKYIEWNDASGNYQNVKVFGDDLRLYYDFKQESITTTLSTRVLIDNVLEPILSSSGVINMASYASVRRAKELTLPEDIIRSVRTQFIERGDISPSILEKTEIQGLLDRHFYGEPVSYKEIDGVLYAVITNAEADKKIYDPYIQLYNSDDPDPLAQRLPPSSQPTAGDQTQFGLYYDAFIPVYGDGLLAILAGQIASVSETVVIECINEAAGAGMFSVRGSVTGETALAYASSNTMLDDYDSGTVKFKIIPGTIDFVVGDAFIIQTFAGEVISANAPAYNLNGKWKLIDSTSIGNGEYSSSYSPGTDVGDNRWIIKIEKNDDSEGNIIDIVVTYRDLKTIVESPSTKFWYNSSNPIFDVNTKKRVVDKLQILKSNLDKQRFKAIGKNNVYDVISSVRYNDGIENVSALEVLPTDNSGVPTSGDSRPDNILQFTQFVNVTDNEPDYVYFKQPVSGRTVAIEATPTVLTAFNGVPAGQHVASQGDFAYIRKYGRDKLDFLWQHFTPNGNLIDPSTSNIIDIFILTQGYYDNLTGYVTGTSSIPAVAPTPLELRNTYRHLLKTKMLSDTVVLHPGRIKLLFGDMAEPQVRAKFKVLKSPLSTLGDDQLRAEILDVIREYFSVDNWDFGDVFYATELFALIHQRLPLDVSSVVLVPTFADNLFGNLFVVESSEDEVLQSSATINDIELVQAYNSATLKQIKN